MATYRVYYMNNDRQKIVVKSGLQYFAAHDFVQKNHRIYATKYEYCNLQIECE